MLEWIKICGIINDITCYIFAVPLVHLLPIDTVRLQYQTRAAADGLENR